MSRPTALAGAGFEEGLEGGAHGRFVGDVETGELPQCRVAVFDRVVRRFERHFNWVRTICGRVDSTIAMAAGLGPGYSGRVGMARRMARAGAPTHEIMA